MTLGLDEWRCVRLPLARRGSAYATKPEWHVIADAAADEGFTARCGATLPLGSLVQIRGTTADMCPRCAASVGKRSAPLPARRTGR